jgi:hypothetical protein
VGTRSNRPTLLIARVLRGLVVPAIPAHAAGRQGCYSGPCPGSKRLAGAAWHPGGGCDRVHELPGLVGPDRTKPGVGEGPVVTTERLLISLDI